MNITKTSKDKNELNHQSKPFLIIGSNYSLETLYNILSKNPSLINVKDQKNETFLSYAIKRKNIEICELILTSPLLDILYTDIKGNSYLHLAVINQLEIIIRLLIKKGIDVNLQNKEGNTALHFAYNTGDIKYIAILMENNADLNIKNKNGLIPEEIEMDSLFDKSNDNENNLNVNNNSDNSVTINIDEKNNSKKYNNSILSTDKSKINKSIKLNWENNNADTLNEVNNSKNNIKYSLVNFSYSDDENYNAQEHKNKKLLNVELNKAKTEHLKNCDFFDLTSTLTYKEKLASISCINSHIVGNPNVLNDENLDNEDDMVNIKKLKAKENNSVFNSVKNKNKINNIPNFKTEINKIGKEYLSNGNYFYEFKTFKDNFSTPIEKEEKDILCNKNIVPLRKKNNINQNNNDENTITYQPDFNNNFEFSPFGTIQETLNKKNDNNKINKESINDKIKNIRIFDNTQMDNNTKENMNKNLYSDSLIQPDPNFLNSKSIIDLNSSGMTTVNTVNKSNNPINKYENSLYKFLSEIKLEKYYNIMNINGFEDFQVLIDQEKTITAITDLQLKETGIDIPGDRAKILIRLQEKAGNFMYQIPKNVYYICNELENYKTDYHIIKLKEWLKALKIENYLENFIQGGYHSVELMLIQMGSKNPITDTILKDELRINKIGHRARIINKVIEEGKRFNNKLKTSMLVIGKGQTEKICDCSIF